MGNLFGRQKWSGKLFFSFGWKEACQRSLTQQSNLTCQEAAVACLREKFHAAEASEARHIYITQPTDMALHTLLNKAQGSAITSTRSHASRLQHLTQAKGYMYFSIIEEQPSRSKRAKRGSLASSDIAIAVHKEIYTRPPFIWVSCRPINLTYVVDTDLPLEQAALVLTTHVLSLAALNITHAMVYVPDMLLNDLT